MDLLDTHLDFLDTNMPSKAFVSLQDPLKTSSRHVFKTSSINIFKTCSRHVFKTSLRHVFKMSWNVFSITIFCLSRRLGRFLQDVLEDEKLLPWRRVEDVFKTYLEDDLKTSWRSANVCWIRACVCFFRKRTKKRAKKMF